MKKADYKRLCASHGLRYGVDPAGDPISRTRSRKRRQDAMWCAYSDEWVGVTVERETRQALTWAIKKLEAVGCVQHQTADTEANLRCPLGSVPAAAAYLKCTKAKISGGFKSRAQGDRSP